MVALKYFLEFMAEVGGAFGCIELSIKPCCTLSVFASGPTRGKLLEHRFDRAEGQAGRQLSRVASSAERITGAQHFNNLSAFNITHAKSTTFLHQYNTSPTVQDPCISTTLFLQSLQAYVPEGLNWKGCASSKEGLRGYPCSMWMMFHSLTVGAFNKKKGGCLNSCWNVCVNYFCFPKFRF